MEERPFPAPDEREVVIRVRKAEEAFIAARKGGQTPKVICDVE